jgi:hypothetical protein
MLTALLLVVVLQLLWLDTLARLVLLLMLMLVLCC